MNTYIIETENNLRDIIKECVREVFYNDFVPLIQNSIANISKEDDFVNIKSACKILSVSYPTLRKMIDTNELNYEKIGRRYLINKNDLFGKKNQFKLIKRA